VSSGKKDISKSHNFQQIWNSVSTVSISPDYECFTNPFHKQQLRKSMSQKEEDLIPWISCMHKPERKVSQSQMGVSCLMPINVRDESGVAVTSWLFRH